MVRHGFGYHTEQPGQHTHTHTHTVTGALSFQPAIQFGESEKKKIPDNDDDEVQQVPATAYVGAGVHDETVGQDLGEGLDGEDDEEDILDLFLRTKDHARWRFRK